MAANATNSRFQLPPPAINFTPEVTLGPWFIGFAIEIMLTGGVVILVVSYFRAYASQDRPYVRGIVVVLLLLSLLKSLQVGAEVWHNVIYGWGNFARAVTQTSWYAALDALHSSIIVTLCQSFYVLRLKTILQRFHWVLFIIILAMITSLTTNFATSVLLFKLDPRKNSELFQKWQTAQTVGIMTADLLICSTFCWFLLKARTGMARTDSLVERIILVAWTTALIPVLNDIGRLVSHDVYAPKKVVFLAFSFMQSKLYVISVMITLCLRQALRTDGGGAYNVSGKSSRSQPGQGPSGGTHSTTTNSVHFVNYSNGHQTNTQTRTMPDVDDQAAYELEFRKKGEFEP